MPQNSANSQRDSPSVSAVILEKEIDGDIKPIHWRGLNLTDSSVIVQISTSHFLLSERP